MYEIIRNYRNNDALRTSFNELAHKTFGLDFEDWYQNGFWSDSYCPYSIVADGRILSNVSVNHTDIRTPDGVKHFLQLGTVMTDVSHRKKGLCRRLLQQILADFECRCDGIYLFANDSVLDFYPRFGFLPAKEYQYTRKVTGTGKNQLQRVPMDSPADWKKLENAMKHTVFHGRFDMIDNPGLVFFYVTKFMRENVFWHEETDTYVIMEHIEETIADDSMIKTDENSVEVRTSASKRGRLLLHGAFSGTLESLEDIISLLGGTAGEISLGFTPADTTLWQAALYREEDCTLFVKGEALKMVETDRLRFPSLAHA